MVRTVRWWTSLRGASLPQVGQGAFLGQQLTCMVATWGRTVSMACVLRWGLGEAPHQYAGPNFRCQVPLCRSNELSASARSIENFEAMDAHGGWVASAVDLVRFAATL